MPGFSDLTSEAGLVAQAVCAEADSIKQRWVLAAFVYLLRASPKAECRGEGGGPWGRRPRSPRLVAVNSRGRGCDQAI